MVEVKLNVGIKSSKLSVGDSKLKKLKVKTVVDLGCGSGDIIIHFCKRHKELRGVGLDIIEELPRSQKTSRKQN